MKKGKMIFGLVLMWTLVFLGGSLPGTASEQPVSGRVDQGIRILEPAPDAASFDFTVFRGDPVKLDLNGFDTPPGWGYPPWVLRGCWIPRPPIISRCGSRGALI